MTTTIPQDQVKADALEQIIQVDPTFNELYDEMKIREAEFKKSEAEFKAAKELIREYMIEKHAKKVKFGDKELATLTTTQTKKFNYAKAEEDLGADVVAKYVSYSNSTRLNIK